MIRHAIAASIAICGAGVLAAHAQESPPAATETLQTVTVTGSYIQRSGTETPSPLQVITAQDLANSGYTDVSDVLRQISANGQGTLSQAFDQAFASGGSGIALRGLTVAGTLVLVDGERMVSYPLSDDNQRSFVDLSDIPLAAVDRIEVLKDGASALYGADAIAGVVNVILKKTYTGFTATAEAGDSQEGDGTLQHFTAIGGIGDLASDGYNAYLSLEFRHQDPILAANRQGMYTNLDWRGFGGVNTTPGAAGDPLINGGYPLSITGYLVNPSTGAYTYLPGCNAAQQAANQCTFSYNGLQIQPRTENINVLTRLTKSLGPDWQASVSAALFNSQADQVAAAYPQTDFAYGGLTPIYFGPGVPPTLGASTLITVPASYPGNTSGMALPLEYSFRELGVPQIETSTDTYRLMAEVKGAADGWTIDGTAGVMYSRMLEQQFGNPNAGALQAALNDPASPYMVGPGASPNGAALFAPVDQATPTSQLNIVDVHGSRTLATLPGGPLALAAGVQYFDSILNARAPPEVATGLQIGNPNFVVGSQADSAAFLELDARPVKSLEANGAVRYDHYDTYGGSATSKFGLMYTPIDQFAIRATWGQGFRAPSIAESGQSGELFAAGAAPDPVLCPHPSNPNAAGNFPSQCSAYLIGFQTANPQLKAVHSTNLTAGFIAKPAEWLDFSADYYEIKLTNDVISAFEAGGLLNYTSLVRGAAAPLAYCTATNVCSSTVMTPVGVPLFAQYSYVNASATRTDGWDLDAKAPVDLGSAGRLTAELTYTHMMSYVLSIGGNSYQLAGTHGPSGISGDTGNPKDHATLSLSWDRGPIDVTATTNYVGAFSVTDPSSGLGTCLGALTQSGTTAYGARFAGTSPIPGSFCTVHSFTDVDLYTRYALDEHLSVHASILNVFNAPPPLDMQTYGGGGELAYNPAWSQAGAVGRFFTIGATYTF